MADETLSKQIARLEERIEALAATIEGCRKFMLFSKIAIVAGALWWIALMVGAVWFDAAWMIASLAAVIGGVVMLGSNLRTLQEAQADMTHAEALRAELIGRIDLHLVGHGETETSSVIAFPRRRTLH